MYGSRLGRPVAVTLLMVSPLLSACTSGEPAEAPTASKAPSSVVAPANPVDPANPADPAAGWWRPRPGLDWQWQLSGRLDPTVDVPVYDIDGFDHDAAAVAGLHERGRKVICYLSTGAHEDFRPDADAFPAALLGRGNGWDGERWLDIRRTDLLEPLMETRIAMCAEKGFDAVEPDNMDGYRNDTGFPLTAADQLAYNRLIARVAHRHGLAVGLKNDLDQIPALEPDFDFAVNEQCAQYEECDELVPFVEADKAVFHVEYELPAAAFCARSRELGLSSLEKKYELGAWRRSCATDAGNPAAP